MRGGNMTLSALSDSLNHEETRELKINNFRQRLRELEIECNKYHDFSNKKCLAALNKLISERKSIMKQLNALVTPEEKEKEQSDFANDPTTEYGIY